MCQGRQTRRPKESKRYFMSQHVLRTPRRKGTTQRSRRVRWIVGSGVAVFTLLCGMDGIWRSEQNQPERIAGLKLEASVVGTLSELLAIPTNREGVGHEGVGQ